MVAWPVYRLSWLRFASSIPFGERRLYLGTYTLLRRTDNESTTEEQAMKAQQKNIQWKHNRHHSRLPNLNQTTLQKCPTLKSTSRSKPTTDMMNNSKKPGGASFGRVKALFIRVLCLPPAILLNSPSYGGRSGGCPAFDIWMILSSYLRLRSHDAGTFWKRWQMWR